MLCWVVVVVDEPHAAAENVRMATSAPRTKRLMPTSYEPEQWGFPPRSLTSASCARVKGVREVPRQGRDPCRANVAFLTEGQQALRHEPLRRAIRSLAERLPILWQGSVLDGELTAGRFSATMAALYGSREHAPKLRFVVFDVPVLAGVDLRGEPWQARRERLELLAQAFDLPYEPSPLVGPSQSLVVDMEDGRLEGIVLSAGDAPYRGGSRASWSKVKDRGWYEREAWRFQRR